MTKEQQHIAIANALGYTMEIKEIDYDGEKIKFGYWRDENGQSLGKNNPPDYLNDLNAMHEAEMIAGFDRYPLREIYYPHLIDAKDKDGTDLPIWLATAAQRAEAFLRTLELWEDEQ